jgi:MFS family permease
MEYLASLREEVRNLQGDGRGKALLVVSSGSFLLIGVQMIFPVMLPKLRTVYDLSLTTAGALLTALWVANAVGQLPGGMLADELGEGTTLLISVVASAVTLLLLVTVGSVLALFATTVLFGLGLALYGVARYTAIYDLYPDRAGTTIGLVLASADAGQALLPPVAGFVAVTVAWEFGFGFTIPVFVLVATGLYVYVPRRTSPATRDTTRSPFADVRTVLTGLRRRSTGYGTAILFVYVTIWVAFTSLYPTYLIEVKGLSSTVAAAVFGSFFAMGVVTKPLAGAVYDRVGARLSLLAIGLVSGLALAAVPLVAGVLPLVVVTVSVAPILGTGTVSQSYLIDSFVADVKGTGLGAVRSGAIAIAAVMPTVFGATAERGFFDEMFLVLAGLAVLMVLFVLLIPDVPSA